MFAFKSLPSRIGTPRPARRRVLIIEDQSDSRESLRRLVECYGHEVFVAADGLQGVAAAMAHRPDVAVVDIGLPGLDGYEVARRLRADLGDSIFLIAYTAYGRSDDRALGRRAGFDLSLVKPDGLGDLIRILGAWDGR